ncbi:kininogen-1 [Pholidichthys leucotaenia]
MRTGVGLCVLGLLCLHSTVFSQVVMNELFCDDPLVENAVHKAVDHFNKRLSTQHKIALFQIEKATKSEDGSDPAYLLHFTTRSSNCAADSAKPWTECDYLPSKRKRPFSCNATVHVSDTETDVKHVGCQLEDDLFEEKAHCLGCPIEISKDSEDLKAPLSASISKFNSISDSTHLFSLHDVGKATRQVVAGFRYKMTFDMKKTTCAKAEHSELSELCAFDNNVEFSYCNSTVDVAPWRLEEPQAHIECAPGAMPPKLLSRRRPPGWSPLRDLQENTAAGPAQPMPQSTQPASSAPAKEESSEEETAASHDALHCPTKPWKPFKPTKHAKSEAPTVVSPQPAADGFSDTDLLG